MTAAINRRQPSSIKSVYGSPLFEDDRDPLLEAPLPTMARDVDCNPIPEIPRPMRNACVDVGVEALSLSPDRESLPEPQPRVRFDFESRDFVQPDSDLDLTPTKLSCIIQTKPDLTCRSLRLSLAGLDEDQRSAGGFGCKTAATKMPSGPHCSILPRKDASVRLFDSGIKVPFSSLGPLASAPDPPRQYTVHDHTLGTKTQKQLQTSKHTPNKGRKPVVSKVLGLQKRVGIQRSTIKSTIQRHTNHGASDATFKYGKPELHSSLKLARTMQKLQVSKVDTQEELRKIMREEEISQKLMQKASLPVNIPFTEKQFKDLTPVDVATGEVVAKLLQDQEARMKSHQPSPRPKDEAPDLLDFYDDSIYHEAPCWAVHFPPVSLDFPVSAPSDCAFSQYRRLRMWENDTDGSAS